MKLLFSKAKMVEQDIFTYLELINSEKEIFIKAFHDYLEKGDINELQEYSKNAHVFESKADDLRRKIEYMLYQKVLLPQFRGDVISLLERLDKLPDECQTVLFMIGLQYLEIPEILKEKLRELISLNTASIEESISLVKILFTNPKEVESNVKAIDSLESRSDRKERELIQMIFFDKTIEKCDKILLKELVLEIGNISDNAESISDMVTIINLKVKI